MRNVTLVILLIVVTAVTVGGQQVSITGPNRQGMVEGRTYTITWRADELESISLVAHGIRTPLGTESRGDYEIVIAEGTPALQGKVDWTVPWIDGADFFIKAKGYDAGGKIVAIDERGYDFRPAVLANRMKDGIYLDLHQRVNQRLYVQKNSRITHVYLSTSSQNYLWLPPNRHMKVPHDHAGVFRVLEKELNHWSVLFSVDMPYAMRYHGGHFIHATSPNMYQYLGTPASSGCNRLTLTDARELYMMTPVGTRVEVIGP